MAPRPRCWAALRLAVLGGPAPEVGLGLAVGPLFAWLCWAVQRRRWGWASLALLANLALWIGGAAVIAEGLKIISA